MTIGEFVQTKPVYVVDAKWSVYEVARYMAEKNIGAVPVLDDSRLVGIFSERDMIKRIVGPGLDPRTTIVQDVMTHEIVVSGASENFEDCFRKMKQANVRHLPVVDGERLLGVVSLRDMLQLRMTEREERIEFLTDYLFHLPPDAASRRG